MFAPHLPPPSSSISSYHAWQRIKIFLVSTLLGLCAGAAASAVIISWLLPLLARGAVPVFFTYHRSADTPATMIDQAFVENVSAKIFSVYSAVHDHDGLHYFDPQDLVAPAITVSSDGWFVAPVKRSPAPNSIWYLPGINGEFASSTKLIFDPVHKLVYFHVGAVSVLPGLNRPFENAVEPVVGDRGYFLTQNHIEPAQIESAYFQHETPFVSWPLPRFSVAGLSGQTGFVVDRAGRLIGIRVVDGTIMLSADLQEVLPNIFSRKSIASIGLGVVGWYSEHVPLYKDGQRINGFLVTQVLTKNNPLKKGDVIKKIGNDIVRAHDSWYTTPTTSTFVTILRGGNEQRLEVPLVPLDN